MGLGLEAAYKNKFFYRLGLALHNHLPRTTPLINFIKRAFALVQSSNRKPEIRRVITETCGKIIKNLRQQNNQDSKESQLKKAYC